MLQQNFAYLLEKKAFLHPEDIAIVEARGSQKYTYLELCQRSNRLANLLQGAGVAKGDRVSCLTANSVEYIDIFMAAARLGALLTPLNHRLAPVEMIKILGDSKPKVFIFDGEFGHVAQEIAAANLGLILILSFGSGEFRWAKKMEETVRQYGVTGPEIAGDSEDPLLMLYTAGSTGRPKGVPLKQTNLFFNAINWILDVGITKEDYTMTVIPLFHIGGHMLWTLPHLMVGGKILLQRRFEPEATLRLLAQEKITNVYFIPAMAKMVLALPHWKDFDLSQLRFIGAGGEPVPEKVTRAFGEIGIPVLNSYGLTETSDGTTTMRPWDAPGKPANCIGKALTMTDVRIVDSDGRDAGAGVEGEILHRGPSVVHEYWRRPEESAKAFRDGWLHTGDRAVRDEAGFIHFLGRKDDMIITGGENVYPAEVEEVILSHSKVADVAIIGIPDDKWGQTIKAIIAPKSGMSIETQEILGHVKARLSGFKQPRLIQFVESLPKIGSGKLDRVSIKNLYGLKIG